MNRATKRALGCAVIAGAACAAVPAFAANDQYVSFPMLYGRESTASDDPTMTMGLLFQPAFTYLDRDGSAAGTRDKSEFSFQRLRWYVKGSATRDVDYLLVTEWARNGATSSSDGGARAFRARATLKDVGDATNLAFGSIIVPFGHAFYVPAESAPWVNYTRMTTNLYGCGSTDCTADQGEMIADIWKTGMMAFDQLRFGADSSLTYTAGVYNSSGTRFQDDGTQKDFNGSLEFNTGNVFVHYGVRLGSQQDTNGDEMDRQRHAVVLRYNDYRTAPWWLWAEAMQGTDETTGADREAEGFEVSAGYKFAPSWEGVVRYSEFDPNKDVSRDEFEETSVGLTYRAKRGIRWQVQVDSNSNKSETVDDMVYTVRLTVPFAKKLM